jgi:hypothetical protein
MPLDFENPSRENEGSASKISCFSFLKSSMTLVADARRRRVREEDPDHQLLGKFLLVLVELLHFKAHEGLGCRASS